MSLESASFIADLVSTNPLGTDKRKLGDDHLRLIKAVLQSTFPNASTAFWFPRISAKSASFSFTANDDNTTFLVDTTAGDVTVSAPAASGLNARFKCRIVKTSSDANKITFDPNGSETVNGAATLDILNQNIPADFYCDATQWFAVAGQWFGLTAAEVTVASASTCDILGAASALVAISGTTTITSLGTGANRVRFVRFTGALTLTHDATSLILPGGANITTAAGDTMIVESDASSNARVLAYQRASGLPIINPVINPAFNSRLTKVSSNLQLDRCSGNYLFIDGANETIPSGGVTLAATGLSSGTTYYIYAYMDSGTMTLEASATAPATDGTYGHKIKTGDGTRTLVGMARVVSGPAWADSDDQRFVISYYNRRTLAGLGSFSTGRSTSSTSFVELNSEIRVEFLTWGDEAVHAAINGALLFNFVTSEASSAIGFDGTTPDDAGMTAITSVNTMRVPVAGSIKKGGLSEGYHYATLLGKVSVNTGTWAGSASAGAQNRCSLNVGIRG